MTVKSSEEAAPRPENSNMTDTATVNAPPEPASKLDLLQSRTTNGTNRPQRVLSQGPGYVAATFEGKAAQMDEVRRILEEKGFIPDQFIDHETRWFYDMLGIDDQYFQTESLSTIVDLIHLLYSAKTSAYVRQKDGMEVRLAMEDDDHAIYIDTSKPGITNLQGPNYEICIDDRYVNKSSPARSYRVETFRSPCTLPGNNEQMMRCYFVYQCQFENQDPGEDETDINIVGDKRFLQKATQNTKVIYQDAIVKAVSRSGPIIEIFDVEGAEEKRMVIAYRQGSTMGFFSALSDLYHYYGLTTTRKYLESFSNGVTVISLYLRQTSNDRHTGGMTFDAITSQIKKEISLLYCVPQTKFQEEFSSGRLSLQEIMYAHCVWVFTQHFVNRLGTEFNSLLNILDNEKNSHLELLQRMKKRLREETFTPSYILEIIKKYPDLVHKSYIKFASAHYLTRESKEDEYQPTLSFLRIQAGNHIGDDELSDLVKRTTHTEKDEMVMLSFLTFNRAVQKTNFFTPTKVALSFRLDASFLPSFEYPKVPFGTFLIIGSEFRGFHLRFRDIARGGIRIVKSQSPEIWAANARSLFDENYNLASTQQRKNKDIPEGGAKGVILLDTDHQDKAKVAFEKYIDSILDLLLPPTSPGIKDPIIDHYGEDEILFMGPDENTADLVDWATLHARKRGASFWKSFFTGKSPKLGGIPHDEYGMTTLSVREFVEGIYRKLDIDPKTVKKGQTGGPDGDLGSNEIKLAKETYTAIVDGSGVIVDPQGLDSTELLRLAEKRAMISEFDTSKMSPQGYRVLVNDKNILLPNGETVGNGVAFRNSFHLRKEFAADLFVPCGGRPESVNLSNVDKLIEDGKCRFRYIVEGANLFLTQDSKIRLEEAGCIVFKDASVNKGGVTSSSLEVLAALALDDKEFVENMCFDPASASPPQFYAEYVRNVQEIIKRNASLEFEALWHEHAKTKTPQSRLSDKLSLAITSFDEELKKTDLWENEELRKTVMRDALPRVLLEKLGFDTIMRRVPESYLRSIFSSYLASRFVYEYGSEPGNLAFHSFMLRTVPQLATKEDLAQLQ
ncbi:NAD-dependent glutamate dehydrogenase [Ascosphaera pollenicola]|nr:NAD-dependent glutamate dehydrogenase [Ascosphaera pollenicola]